MNSLYLAWNNLISKPLRFFFNIFLLAIASGLIALSFLINVQFNNHFEKNLANVDLIIAGKGSPLQSVLCNLFHLDAPTGNIPLKEAAVFLKPDHPIIKSAVPLSMGDQLEGFRIVGTTLNYFEFYNLSLYEGSLFDKDYEAVLGADVATSLKLKIGSEFVSGHGLVKETELNHDKEPHYMVRGILKKSGGISDRLVFVSISSYWSIHHHEHVEDHVEGTLNENHLPVCIKNEDLLNVDGEISSILLAFKGTNLQSLNFGRSINENTGLMASSPPMELNRMYELTGSASDLISIIASLLALLAVISLFISMWQTMEDRKFEIAILRLGGASAQKIIGWTVLEACILVTIGVIAGIILAHFVLIVLVQPLALQTKYGIEGFRFFKQEIYILGVGIIVGIISSLIPAVKVIRRNIHDTLIET